MRVMFAEDPDNQNANIRIIATAQAELTSVQVLTPPQV
jgi:hypothetical protein